MRTSLKRCKEEPAIKSGCRHLGRSRPRHRILQVCSALCAMLACGTVSFAAINLTEINALGNDLKSFATALYGWLVILGTIIAGCMAIAALIARMFGSQQSATRATQWLIRVLISYAILVGLGVIFTIIGSLFGATVSLPAAPAAAP